MLKKYLFVFFTILTLLIATGCTEAPNENTELSTATSENSKEEPNAGHEMKVHYIDVGQADSTLIQYSGDGEEYTILIDAGNFNSTNVSSYLQSQNINQIDIAIGTHPDADHIGQLDQVVNTFDVDEVWLSGNASTSQTFQDVLSAIDSKGIEYHEPRMGEEYDIGPLEVEILYPRVITGKSNEESISLKMTYGNVRFVFTGDAAQENELEMVNSGSDLKAEILHLGHHGSNTSTNQVFLNAVNPEVAIYSAGEDNQYGHPHAEVVNLVRNSGIKLYGTDVNGTIIVTTDGKGYSIETKENGTISPSSVAETPEENPVDSESNNAMNPPAINGNCIDINTASIEQVQNIIHIGPARAQDLVNLRPFNSVDDLSKIDGIGPAKMKDILAQGLACVGG
ncbi:MBL fold metallo-hydrolase [Bacillus sp. V3B]|uniref:MBL fold metallo-hydrolase n=1 Tax=Bacillus sp. V3B TaxID=2804915 RepID=UPI0021093E6E|nr:MBL fold metallo-hydrolase [Bacillus sp. V3B]MCQ6276578.1 MBL fold metallo-hydrolase [Bacillus sp. V3B]